MIAVPFIYFSILLGYIIFRKKAFDISAYIISLYLISSFFSILIDINGLRHFDTIGYQIGLFPTVLYCGLLTLTIWPFYKFNSEKIVRIDLTDSRSFNRIVLFFFSCFLFIVFSSINNVIQILNGDFGEMRVALNRGESVTDISVGGILKPFFIIANIFGGYSLIMLLFYFYSLTFLKRSKLFNAMILISSMTIIIIGILGVDRSKTIYWMITYGLMLVLFWKHMATNQRKSIILVSVVLISLVLSYFLAVTISRFGERDTGTEGGMIAYAGQSFINFCFFFDQVDYKDFSLQRIFPLFYKMFNISEFDTAGELNAHISLKTGKEIAVFSTFIGDILVSSSKLAAILYCVCFAFLTKSLLTFAKFRNIYFYELIIVFCLLTVPMLGLFSHFYSSFPRTIPLLFFMLYAFHLGVRRTTR